MSRYPLDLFRIRDISSKLALGIIAASTVVAIALHIALYAAGLYSISADECGRTLDAQAWVDNGTIIVDAWLPFYQVVVGVFLRLAPDLFATPRLVSFAFGLATHAALIALAWALFQRRDVMAYTAVLSACIHHRVLFAVVPLSEIMFFCTLLAALALLAHWLRTERTLFLLAGALSLAISTTIRYEAWFFGVVFAGMLLANLSIGKKFLPATRVGSVLALVVLAAFPAWWLWQQYLHTGHPIGFLLHSPDRFVPTSGTSLAAKLWHNSLLQFGVQNTITMMLVGMIPAVVLWRDDTRLRAWLAVPLGALLLLSLVLLAGKGLTTHNPWRIASSWSLLLVPFAALQLVSLARSSAHSTWQRWSIPALIVALCLFQTAMYARVSSTFTKAERAMGEYIGRSVIGTGTEPRILVETSTWQYLNIEVAAQHPNAFLRNTGADPLFPQRELFSPNNLSNAEALHAQKITHLLFSSPVYKWAIEQAHIATIQQQYGEWTLYTVQQ